MDRRKFLQMSVASSVVALPLSNFKLEAKEKKHIIVQEVYLDVEVKAIPVFFKKNGDELLVATYGFNSKGEVLSRRSEEVKAPIKQEWIEKEIINAARYSSPKECGKEMVANNRTSYVIVVRRSDVPNEIGFIADIEPIFIKNSSVTVTDKGGYRLGYK